MPTMSASNTNPGTHIRPHIKTIFTITSLNIFGKKKKKSSVECCAFSKTKYNDISSNSTGKYAIKATRYSHVSLRIPFHEVSALFTVSVLNGCL